MAHVRALKVAQMCPLPLFEATPKRADLWEGAVRVGVADVIRDANQFRESRRTVPGGDYERHWRHPPAPAATPPVGEHLPERIPPLRDRANSSVDRGLREKLG